MFEINPFAITPSSIQNWWKLDGNANDSKGVSNGTLVYGGYTTGINGNCLNVASSIDFPNMDAITTIVGAKFSFSMWVKPAAVPYVNESFVFHKGAADVMTLKFIGSTSLVFALKEHGASNNNYWNFNNSTNYLTAGVWSHIVITYDGNITSIVDRVRFYVDKILITPSSYFTSLLSKIQSNANPFTIGNDGLGVANAEIHQVDDLRFSEGILQYADIEAAYNFNNPDYPYITGISGYQSGVNRGIIGEAIQITGTQFLKSAPVCQEIPNNKVNNGAFCTTIAGWTTAVMNSGALTATWVSETASLAITNLGSNSEKRNCRFEFLNSLITQNTSVFIYLNAKCTGASSKTIRVALLNNNDINQVIYQQDFTLTGNYQDFTTSAIPIAAQTNIAVSIQVGGTTNPGDVQINTINVQQV
jgi:hypothetical protein